MVQNLGPPLSGQTGSARENHIEFVLSKLESTPSSISVPISKEFVAFLNSEIKRTGTNPTAIVRNMKRSGYVNISLGFVQGLISGKLEHADKDQIDAIQSHLRSLSSLDEIWIEISDQQHKELKKKFFDAKISAPEFFRIHNDMPKTLSVNRLHQLLSGNQRKIRRADYEYAVKQLEEVIASHNSKTGYKYKSSKGVKFVILTEEVRAELASEMERTGVNAAALFRMNKGNPILDGVKVQQVSQWLHGIYKSANAELFEFLIEAWRKLPDKNSYWN